MLYFSDSPVSQFSSFEEEDPREVHQKRLKSAAFDDFFGARTISPLNSYHEDINIVNKMHQNQ